MPLPLGYILMSSVAQLDVPPIGYQEVPGSIPAGSSNILSWRLIMKIFVPLPLIQERQLSVSGKRMCTSTS